MQSIYIKLLGAALVTLASTSAGAALSADAKKKTSQLEGFEALFAFAARELQKSPAPLEYIYKVFENRALENTGMLRALRDREPPPEAFARLRMAGGFALDAEDAAPIEQGLQALGRFDAATQAQLLSDAASAAGERCASVRARQDNRARMYSGGGFLMGLFISLMFF